MPMEFICLGALILLALVNILWAGSARTKQYGRDWNMGARDDKMPPLDPISVTWRAGRRSELLASGCGWERRAV